MKQRPDVALNMLLRNLVGQPEIAQFVFGMLDTTLLPPGPASELLKRMHNITREMGFLNSGHVEELIDTAPDQRHAAPLKMRAVVESREILEGYVASLREWLELKALEALVAEIQLKLSAPNVDVAELRATLANGLVRERAQEGLRDLSSYAGQAIDMIMLARQGQRPGRSVGFGPTLDEYWWLEPGAISIVAGRPGSGKTSFVTSSILCGATPETPEAFFSIEMAGYAIAQRLACSLEGVSLADLRKGRTDLASTQRVIDRLQSLANRGIFMDDDVVSMDDVYFRCLSMPIKPRVVWIDYGEKVVVDRGQRRDLELGFVYTRAKQIAKRLSCHVVVLAQLKRDVDARPDKWPTLSDISESGAAEKDADIVAFMMRPEYYFTRNQTCRVADQSDRYGVAYCIVAKNRDGPIDTVRLNFDNGTMTFREYQGPMQQLVTIGRNRPDVVQMEPMDDDNIPL